jgi:hypothetical protein
MPTTSPTPSTTRTARSTDARSLKEKIADILDENGESFICDSGVDPDVVDRVASDIMTTLRNHQKTPRVLVEVRGGNVQMTYADAPVQIKIKDWDNIKEGDAATYLEDVKIFDGPDETISPELFDKTLVMGVDKYLAYTHEMLVTINGDVDKYRLGEIERVVGKDHSDVTHFKGDADVLFYFSSKEAANEADDHIQKAHLPFVKTCVVQTKTE